MGMYTEVYFRGEVTKEAADIIAYVAEAGFNARRGILPKHSFFDTDRFPMVFNGRSAYFPRGIDPTITPGEEDEFAKYGPEAHRWAIVEFRANLKNYENEIDLFFDWIEPQVRDNGFMGYSLYEEDTIPLCYIKEY